MKKKANNLVEFEASAEKLEEILKELSSKEVTLSQSIELYAQAAQLIQQCNDMLQQAQISIDEIDLQMQTLIQEEQHEL